MRTIMEIKDEMASEGGRPQHIYNREVDKVAKAYALEVLLSVREVAVEYSKETTIENIDVLINELKAK